jgi:putative transposase
MTLKSAALAISRATMRQIALGVDRYNVMRARFGRQTANNKRGARTAGVLTIRPLERVEIDHFLVDVHLIDEKTGANLGRPWLTAAVDHYSGMVVGYHLSFSSPSSASVLAALRHAILPK